MNIVQDRKVEQELKPAQNTKTLIEVRELSKFFRLDRRHILKAVDQVTFDVYKNETLGVVGESGCGKTTLGRTILGLYDKTSGDVLYDGLNVHECSRAERQTFKRKAQIILQDPYSSLNPRMAVGDIIAEGVDAGGLYQGPDRQKRIYDLLNIVGLTKEHASRLPHEFSGGQRQRIGIARTLGAEPEFIVCDEPISALDVSIQAQIVNLLIELQREYKLTYMFIAHDMSMVRHISDRVAVMYLGSLVELTDSLELYRKPLHPYTQALISAIPSTDLDNPVKSRRIRMEGEPQSPINVGASCKFAKRCQHCMPICTEKLPPLREVEPNHFVACFLHERV